jgi:hypothetical protein
MESWRGLTYESIMKMPSTRRIRMIIKKQDLERERRKADERAARRKY